MASENEFLIHSLFTGVFITFLYDILRIFRRVIPHGGFLVSLEDFVFWVYCGSEVFLLMYHESNGTLRWFAVMGALTGMFLYKKFISFLFVKYISILLTKILYILMKGLRYLCRPAAFLWGKTKRGAGRTGHRAHRFLGRLRRRIKNRLTYSLKVLKINLKA